MSLIILSLLIDLLIEKTFRFLREVFVCLCGALMRQKVHLKTAHKATSNVFQFCAFCYRSIVFIRTQTKLRETVKTTNTTITRIKSDKKHVWVTPADKLLGLDQILSPVRWNEKRNHRHGFCHLYRAFTKSSGRVFTSDVTYGTKNWIVFEQSGHSKRRHSCSSDSVSRENPEHREDGEKTNETNERTRQEDDEKDEQNSRVIRQRDDFLRFHG